MSILLELFSSDAVVLSAAAFRVEVTVMAAFLAVLAASCVVTLVSTEVAFKMGLLEAQHELQGLGASPTFSFFCY